MKLLASLLALACPLAAQIHVPGDHASLQAAIDGASTGAVIVVSSGSHEGVVIDKPLTLVFDGSASVAMGCAGGEGWGGCTDCFDGNAFRLDGPGRGTVTIVGYTGQSKDCNFPAPAIGGGGFDEVHLFDCDIRILAGFSGLGHGGSAIEVDVPFLSVSGSRIRAMGSNSDHCSSFLYEDHAAGIDAPGSTVLLVDSEVEGGHGGFLCCIACPCPAMPQPSLGGTGGPGVVAQDVLLAGSTVIGGVGSTFLRFDCCDPYNPMGAPTECGKQADGPAFVATAVHVLEGSFAGPSTVPAGGVYTLAWDLPGPSAYLFLALGTMSPIQAASIAGFIVLDIGSLLALGPIAVGSPQTLPLAVPAESILIGVAFAFQAVDATLGVTRPATSIIVP